MNNKRFLALAAMVLVSGCASSRFVGREGLTTVEATALPPPTRIDMGGEVRTAVIGPLDQVSVEVFGAPELSRTVQVDAGGRLSLPLIGFVDAVGKTPEELAQIVQAQLQGRYVRNPRVAVNLVNPVSQVVTVDGEVRQPGMYPVVGRMTLMRAIARAQGLTEFARPSHVVVFRRVGAQDMAALYDLRSIRQGIYEDPEVYANDVVMVGESQARRLFRDIIQGSGLLTAPIIALLQQSGTP